MNPWPHISSVIGQLEGSREEVEEALDIASSTLAVPVFRFLKHMNVHAGKDG